MRGHYCANAFTTPDCEIQIESLRESLCTSCATKVALDAIDELEEWWEAHKPSYSRPTYSVSYTEGTWPFRATVTIGNVSAQGLPGMSRIQAKRNAASEWLRRHRCYAGSFPRAPDPSELPMPKFLTSPVFHLDADA